MPCADDPIEPTPTAPGTVPAAMLRDDEPDVAQLIGQINDRVMHELGRRYDNQMLTGKMDPTPEEITDAVHRMRIWYAAQPPRPAPGLDTPADDLRAAYVELGDPHEWHPPLPPQTVAIHPDHRLVSAHPGPRFLGIPLRVDDRVPAGTAYVGPAEVIERMLAEPVDGDGEHPDDWPDPLTLSELLDRRHDGRPSDDRDLPVVRIIGLDE